MNNEDKQKKKNSKWIILIVVLASLYYLVPIGLFVFAMITDTYKTEYKVLSDGTVQIDKNKITIQAGVKGHYDEEKGIYYIEGKVTNNTDKEYNYLDINYQLYNAEGEVLGEATSFIQNLGAGKTWNFKATYAEIDAKDVESFEYRSN